MHTPPSRYAVVPGLTNALAMEHLTARRLRGSCNEPFFFDPLYRRLFGEPQDAKNSLVKAALQRAMNSDRYPIEIKMEEASLHLQDHHTAMHHFESMRKFAGDGLVLEACQLAFAYRDDRKLGMAFIQYLSNASRVEPSADLMHLAKVLKEESMAAAIGHANKCAENPALIADIVLPIAAHLLHLQGEEGAMEFAERILMHGKIREGAKASDIVRAIEWSGWDLIASGMLH